MVCVIMCHASAHAITPYTQSISLGTHVVHSDFPEPIALTEIQPLLLARRNFPPLRSLQMVSPGYREAPDPSSKMAIVFVKVSKPAEVLSAQRMEEGLDDSYILDVRVCGLHWVAHMYTCHVCSYVFVYVTDTWT